MQIGLQDSRDFTTAVVQDRLAQIEAGIVHQDVQPIAYGRKSPRAFGQCAGNGHSDAAAGTRDQRALTFQGPKISGFVHDFVFI